MNTSTPLKAEACDEYEKKLATWKLKHGLTTASGDDLTAVDLMRAEDARSNHKAYCWRCGNRFEVKEMIVDTDPYIQDEERPQRDDGYIPNRYRIRVCKRCHEEDEAESDDAES